jgi:hypothetical protein
LRGPESVENEPATKLICRTDGVNHTLRPHQAQIGHPCEK